MECLVEVVLHWSLRITFVATGYSNQIEERNIYAISPRLKAFSDWLLQVRMAGNLEIIFPAATREYAPRIEELVKDSGFRAACNRRNELFALPRVANYFLDRVSYPDNLPVMVTLQLHGYSILMFYC